MVQPVAGPFIEDRVHPVILQHSPAAKLLKGILCPHQVDHPVPDAVHFLRSEPDDLVVSHGHIVETLQQGLVVFHDIRILRKHLPVFAAQFPEQFYDVFIRRKQRLRQEDLHHTQHGRFLSAHRHGAGNADRLPDPFRPPQRVILHQVSAVGHTREERLPDSQAVQRFINPANVVEIFVVMLIGHALSRASDGINRIEMIVFSQLRRVVDPHQRGIIPDAVKQHQVRPVFPAALNHMGGSVNGRNLPLLCIAFPGGQQPVVGFPDRPAALFTSVYLHCSCSSVFMNTRS